MASGKAARPSGIVAIMPVGVAGAVEVHGSIGDYLRGLYPNWLAGVIHCQSVHGQIGCSE